MKRISILLLIIFTCLIAAPISAWAGSHTVYVPPPSGDDTANIQKALDACVAYGSGCTVQLAKGIYHSRQLVEYNFRGTFKGMGQTKTTIQALPNLLVTLPDPFTQGECKPDTKDCLWPSLIIFVDGNITVSDLTIDEPNVPATQPWYGAGLEYTCLNDGIRFMGQNRTKASVRRVTVEGTPDTSATSCPDFNFCNAVIFAGEFPRSQTPFDYYFLSGTFSLSNSSFTNVALGVGADGFLKDSSVTIGGSPLAGNIFKNVDFGPVLLSAQNSVEEISFNTSSGNIAPVMIAPWQDAFVPSKPSLFFLHDNSLTSSGSAYSIYLQDDPTNHWLYALAYNNTINAQDVVNDAIGAVFTTATTIIKNKLSGSGQDGVGIYDGRYAAVLENDVTGFSPNPGFAQIVLDGSLFGLPDTSDSTVICKTPNDSVLNIGTNNKIVGCQQVATAEAQRSTMTTAPNVPKKKPLFP